MKRTKEWWNRLTPNERSRLVYLERSEKYSSGYGQGFNIPDDCCMCGACGTPHSSSGLCPRCNNELLILLKKADGEEE